MSYEERARARRSADAKRQKQQPAPRADFFDLSSDERRAIRQAEKQGRDEAKQLAAIQEQAAKQAAIDATPEHLRRPENVFRKTIELLRPTAYRPDVARRMKQLERQANERDREIESEMAEKLRRYEVENNPETKPAREHWQSASADAETAEERIEWARLKGLVEAGAANRYWTEVQPIMQRRLERLEARIAEHAAKQAPLAEQAKVLAEQYEAASALTVDLSEDQAEGTPAAPQGAEAQGGDDA